MPYQTVFAIINSAICFPGHKCRYNGIDNISLNYLWDLLIKIVSIDICNMVHIIQFATEHACM